LLLRAALGLRWDFYLHDQVAGRVTSSSRWRCWGLGVCWCCPPAS
jgi:hypothetical protein